MIPAVKESRLRWQLAASLAVLGAVACARNHDQDAQKLVDELSSLDNAVDATVHASPNADGLARAEALVGAERTALHDRVVATKGWELGAAASQALVNGCVKNANFAKIAKEYVQNAVLKTNPELVVRANKLADALCEICVTESSDAWICASFATPAPS